MQSLKTYLGLRRLLHTAAVSCTYKAREKVSREQVEITDSESFRLDAKGSDFQDIAPILGSEGVIAPPELALSSATSALSPLRHQGSAGDLGL